MKWAPASPVVLLGVLVGEVGLAELAPRSVDCDSCREYAVAGRRLKQKSGRNRCRKRVPRSSYSW